MMGIKAKATVIDTVTGKRWTVKFVDRRGVVLVDGRQDRRGFTWRDARQRLRLVQAP